MHILINSSVALQDEIPDFRSVLTLQLDKRLFTLGNDIFEMEEVSMK